MEKSEILIVFHTAQYWSPEIRKKFMEKPEIQINFQTGAVLVGGGETRFSTLCNPQNIALDSIFMSTLSNKYQIVYKTLEVIGKH